ncbi:hypothetical protein Q3G72_026381 [Acer saccharum]|nr:hypothetical protein Q3G72_026381 [Acer saccharum]
MESASFSRPVEDLEGKINQLLEALSTTQMITNHFKLNLEITDMERASISRHVEDLEDKINQLLVPLSTTLMITNHFNLNREITKMERASISHHIKDLEGKINEVLVPLSTTHMITKHFKLNRENTDLERASISHPVEDLEGKIKQLLVPLSETQEIIKAYKLDLEKAAEDLEGIPVIDSQDHIAWPPSDSKDGDLEMQNHKSSTNCSEKFQILPQIAATFEALGPKLYLVKSKLWDALIQQDGAISIQQCLLRGKANQAFA